MLKRTITAIALAGAMTLGAQSAQAVALDGWNLNLSVAEGINGLTGLSDITNIDQFTITGESTVVQNFANFSPVGQSFVDSGFLQFTTFNTESSALQIPIDPSLGNAQALYLSFSNLTGVFNADGSITFDAGAGTIDLILDQDGDLNPATNGTSIAQYQIVDPSGGSDVDFFGGLNPTGTIDVTLEQIGGIPGLFTDQNGNDLDLPFVFQLVNVNAQQENPPVLNLDGNGDGTAIVDPISNSGQFNISIVPEPGTLGIFGVGLLGLGIAAARRRRREAAAA